jgi:hypothetical protein
MRHSNQWQKLLGARNAKIRLQEQLVKEGLPVDHPRVAAAELGYSRVAADFQAHDAQQRNPHADALEHQRTRLLAQRMSSRE